MQPTKSRLASDKRGELEEESSDGEGQREE
jgi:hypothetical protein